MSISSARTFIEKSGCGLVVGLGLAIVIAVGLFSGPTCRGGSQGPEEETKPIPVAYVGGQLVSLQTVDEHYRQTAAMFLTAEGGAPPESEAQIYASALNEQVRSAAQRSIAKRKGITVTKEQIFEEVNRQLDGRLAQIRVGLMQSGQLKTGATEAEAQAALAKAIGGDVADWKKSQIDVVEKAYEDPAKRAELESPVLGSALVASVGNGIQLTDEQLKKSKETVVTKRIVFDPGKHKDENLAEKASRVLREIQRGMSFESAMEKYSDDAAPPKKRKGEATVNLERGTIDFDKKLRPIQTLTPGQMTPVFTLSTGETAIYKVMSIDTKLPDNFENQKADLKKARIQQMAFRQIQDEIEALTKSEDLKWESAGFKVLYDWLQVEIDADLKLDDKKRLESLEAIAANAKKVALDPDPIGSRPASLTWFVAYDSVYDKAPPEKKKAMAADWLEAANGVLETIENVDLRVEMARVALDLKEVEQASTSLASAAENNAGASDEALARFQTIEGLLARLTSAGAKKETLDAIRESQDQWKTDAFETLKSDAELNEDYSESGRTKYGDVNRKIARYRALNIIDAGKAAEIEKFQAKWKTEKEKADAEAAAERKKQAEEDKKNAAAAKAKPGADPKKPGTTAPSASDLLKSPGKTGG